MLLVPPPLILILERNGSGYVTDKERVDFARAVLQIKYSNSLIKCTRTCRILRQSVVSVTCSPRMLVIVCGLKVGNMSEAGRETSGKASFRLSIVNFGLTIAFSPILS